MRHISTRASAHPRGAFLLYRTRLLFFTHKNLLLRRFVASRLLFLFRVRPLKTKCRLRHRLVLFAGYKKDALRFVSNQKTSLKQLTRIVLILHFLQNSGFPQFQIPLQNPEHPRLQSLPPSLWHPQLPYHRAQLKQYLHLPHSPTGTGIPCPA